MPKALPQRKRNAILEAVKAGGKRNEVAREHKVSPSTVSAIAKQAGLVSAFDRTLTEKASRAKAADNKAKRTQLQTDLLDDAQRFRGRAWSPYKVPVATAEGVEIVTLSLPPLPDAQRAYTAIGICVDKDMAYERAATDSGAEHAKSMAGRLFTALAQAVSDEPPQTPADG